MASALALGYAVVILLIAILGVVFTLFVGRGDGTKGSRTLTALAVAVFLVALGVEMLA